MKRPILVSYKMLDTILRDQFGLHGNITMSFFDMLEEPIRISELYRISACKFVVPITGVTHVDRVVQIPESNLDRLFTLYVPDRHLWLMYIQSSIDPDKAYAWRIVPGGNPARIHPWNTELSDAGWKLQVTQQLQRYVDQYKEWLQEQDLYTAHARTPQTTFPPRDAKLDALEEAIIHRLTELQSQTKLYMRTFPDS